MLNTEALVTQTLACSKRQLGTLDETTVVYVFEFKVIEKVIPVGMLPVFLPPNDTQICEESPSSPLTESSHTNEELASFSNLALALPASIKTDFQLGRPCYQITINLLPSQIDQSGRQLDAVVTTEHQVYRQAVGTNSQSSVLLSIYSFDCNVQQSSSFGDQVYSGARAAITAYSRTDGSIQTEFGSVISVSRVQPNEDTVRIEAPTIVDDGNMAYFFCILRDVEELGENVATEEQAVISLLQQKGLIRDVDPSGIEIEPNVLPPELELITSGKMDLLGILGAYQPHQYTLGSLNRISVATVLQGRASIMVDTAFFDSFYPVPGDLIYMVISSEKDAASEYTTLYIEYSVGPPQQHAFTPCIFCFIGTFVVRDDSHNVPAIVVALQNMPAQGWKPLY